MMPKTMTLFASLAILASLPVALPANAQSASTAGNPIPGIVIKGGKNPPPSVKATPTSSGKGIGSAGIK